MNHYPHHIGDFLRKTVGLSWIEECAYRRLLDRYYSNEGPLPKDMPECFRAAGASTKEQKKAVEYVLGRYFVLQADGWHNARADDEIAAYRDKADKARENGRHGGRPKTNPVTDSVSQQDNQSGNQSGSFSGTETKANQNQEPRTKRKANPQTQDAPTAPPPWVPPAAWERFAEMRKAKGAKLTAYAMALAIKKLDELSRAGHDPGEVLDQSVLCNWTGLFPVKADRQGDRTLQEKRAANMDALTGEKRERVIDGSADRVGGAVVLSIASDLRKPGRDDVGGCGPGGGQADVG